VQANSALREDVLELRRARAIASPASLHEKKVAQLLSTARRVKPQWDVQRNEATLQLFAALKAKHCEWAGLHPTGVRNRRAGWALGKYLAHPRAPQFESRIRDLAW